MKSEVVQVRSGIANGPDNLVSAIMVYNNEVYVGGNFTNVGNRVAKYNPLSGIWSPLGNVVNGYVNAVEELNGKI